jgi:hypothetical protein
MLVLALVMVMMALPALPVLAAHEYIGRLYVALGNREMAMRHGVAPSPGLS